MLYTQELADALFKAIDGVEIKATDSPEYAFDVIATTEDTDRDGEIIMLDAWDVKNRQKNPVVLANHTYSVQNIIGKGVSFYTKDGVKRLKGVFSQTNPLALLCKDLYAEGMLNAVSVGFIVRQRDVNSPNIITKAELLEVSFVAIPCNPEALSVEARALFAEWVAKGLLIEQKDAVEEEAAPEANASNVPAEPTVTPCVWCGCAECAEQKTMLKEIKSMLDTITKSMANDNATNDEKLKEKKQIAQSIDNAMGEALRHFKKLWAMS